MGMHKSGRNDVKTPGASTSQEKKLGEYIERKQEAYGIPVSQRNIEQAGAKLPERQLQPLNRAKKNMTFDEWYKAYGYDYSGPECYYYEMKRAWRAAHSVKPPVSREYTQAEIESWNAQGGSFTQEEKDNTGWK